MQKSEQIGDLAAALARAHTSFGKVEKSRSNPFYKSKYADLSEIIEATREALSKEGLSVIQSPAEAAEGVVNIETTLIHSSGQWITGRASIPVSKWDAQGVGSALTYGRRYALQSLLNVAAEDDDDGNAAIENIEDKVEAAERRFTENEGENHISDFRRGQFDKNCEKNGRTAQQIETFLSELGNYKQSEQILNKDWEKAIAWASNPLANTPKTASEAVAMLERSRDMAKAQKAVKTKGNANCEDCGERIIKAGVSRETGKSYPAFCSNRACPTRQKGYKKPNGGEMPESSPISDEDVPF